MPYLCELVEHLLEDWLAVVLELVVETKEGGVDDLLWYLNNWADIFIFVMTLTHPKGT